ncbi:SlyX family protein [Halomonas elongata]|uniref:SlyX family protein n=1 Tax=Halomonas elongata TaxID=2746 RepID=UPI0038D4F3DD
MNHDDTPSDLQSRMTVLESRCAYQEDWLDTLDRAVAQQEKRLAQLERLNELMQRKLRDQQRALQENDAATPRPEDEMPPHY